MEYAKLEEIEFCPYCFHDEGSIEQEFEIAIRTWKYYDAENKRLNVNLSKGKEPDVIVFCVKCENEIFENDIVQRKEDAR